MNRSARNKMGVGFGIVAGFLAVASVSFACTAFLGNMTFTTPRGSQTVTGLGNGQPGVNGMDWCVNGASGEPTWTLEAATASNPQTLGISSDVATDCVTTGANSYLPDGTYDIAWAGYQPATPNSGQHTNCHQESTNNVFGVYTVNAATYGGNGKGAVTSGGTWSPTRATTGAQNLRGYANVCVYMIPIPTGENRAPANAINVVLV